MGFEVEGDEDLPVVMTGLALEAFAVDDSESSDWYVHTLVGPLRESSWAWITAKPAPTANCLCSSTFSMSPNGKGSATPSQLSKLQLPEFQLPKLNGSFLCLLSTMAMRVKCLKSAARSNVQDRLSHGASSSVNASGLNGRSKSTHVST